ncbi:MAG: hypothetical protein GXY20_09830 [Clostridiales bacterium]|nr:hypothetical protein [Clostridiales bacterium]
MVFKWILASLAAVFVASGTVSVPAQTGTDIACIVPQVLSAIGEKDARSQECTLGDAVADAVRAALEADIAVVCGGDLINNLLPGEITWDGLRAVFKEDRPLAVAAVTPKELRGILEGGLSHITLDETETIDRVASAYDGFPQISGFMLSYDVSAPPGMRVYEIRLNGEKLDLEDDMTVLKLAATEHMLSGGYGLPVIGGTDSSEKTLSGALAEYMNNGITEYTTLTVRIYPMGGQDGSLKSLFPLGIAAVLILLIVVGNGQRFKHMYDFGSKEED